MCSKTLVVASIFIAGGVLAAAAQSAPGTPQTPSPATHCLDQATGQAKLKTDLASTTGSGADESSAMAASGLTKGSPSGAGANTSPAAGGVAPSPQSAANKQLSNC